MSIIAEGCVVVKVVLWCLFSGAMHGALAGHAQSLLHSNIEQRTAMVPERMIDEMPAKSVNPKMRL